MENGPISNDDGELLKLTRVLCDAREELIQNDPNSDYPSTVYLGSYFMGLGVLDRPNYFSDKPQVLRQPLEKYVGRDLGDEIKSFDDVTGLLEEICENCENCQTIPPEERTKLLGFFNGVYETIKNYEQSQKDTELLKLTQLLKEAAEETEFPDPNAEYKSTRFLGRYLKDLGVLDQTGYFAGNHNVIRQPLENYSGKAWGKEIKTSEDVTGLLEEICEKSQNCRTISESEKQKLSEFFKDILKSIGYFERLERI